MKKLRILFVASIILISACSSMTTAEKNNKRNELNTMVATTIEGLKEITPGLQKELDDSLAYGVANMKLTKVPIVGAGGGEGVLFIKENDQRVYFTVGRFDLGGGWGVRSYKLLMIINSQEVLDKWKEGNWEFEAGAEASAGTASAQGSTSGLNTGFTVHILSDGGASATVTARVIRMSVNTQLTGSN